ncbi:MAG: hydroxyacid dehydrogenase [Anaerolineae bacterium]|nr:hydroxyacid dehydrogenase [Anaerolineae bacterium]
MKLLICDKTEASALDLIRAAGIEVDNRPTITPEELLRDAGQYHGMVVRSRTRITKEVIDAGANLKILVRGGVGLDNIEVKYAESKGIAVRNTPKASADSVAELAIGYLLALARKIPQASASMAAGEWKKKELVGSEIAGKTLGLIGFGNIGQAVGKRAAALGMKVLFWRRTPVKVRYAKQVKLDKLLAQADYISLHVPKTGDTANLLNAEAFAKMKQGVYIINCGRGGTVDEEALYDALVSGKVAGAAMDVFADEKVNPGNAKLFSLKDANGFNLVIGSPHIGASTSEGQGRVGAEVADILIDCYKKNF